LFFQEEHFLSFIIFSLDVYFGKNRRDGRTDGRFAGRFISAESIRNRTYLLVSHPLPWMCGWQRWALTSSYTSSYTWLQSVCLSVAGRFTWRHSFKNTSLNLILRKNLILIVWNLSTPCSFYWDSENASPVCAV
jgi:hypothetical protein